MAKKKVAVIFGGASSEHEVSLVTASNIIRNIPADKYEVVAIGITKKGRWFYFPGDVEMISSGEWEKSPDCAPALLSPDPIHKGFIKIQDGDVSVQKVDVIFPALHGKNGEDGTIQGLLELAGIPYVGCGVLASANCMDKDVTHTILEANGISTARWAVVYSGEKLETRCAQISEELGGFPLFVKPANSGSSVGINKVYDAESLRDAVKIAFTHDKKVIIEEYIKGREIECAVFGNESPIASVCGEIIPENDFYDYDAKYVLNNTRLGIPAELDPTSERKIRETAVKGFTALGCSGLSRVDFFLKEDGTVILNEINTMPGFTPISMYPKLMAQIGVPYSDLLDKLIKLALEKADMTTSD